MNEKMDNLMRTIGTVLSLYLIFAVIAVCGSLGTGQDEVWHGSYLDRSVLLIGPFSFIFVLTAIVLTVRSTLPKVIRRLVILVNLFGMASVCVTIYWSYMFIRENGLSLGGDKDSDEYKKRPWTGKI